MQIVLLSLEEEEHILQTSSSVILQHTPQNLILSFVLIMALDNFSTVSLGCLIRCIASLCAVFLPMDGSFDNSSISVSSDSEILINYYIIFIKTPVNSVPEYSESFRSLLLTSHRLPSSERCQLLY